MLMLRDREESAESHVCTEYDCIAECVDLGNSSYSPNSMTG